MLKRRLAGRPDSEHEQAVVRVVIVLVLAAYYGSLAIAHPQAREGFVTGTLVAAGYGFVSLAFFGWIVAQPRVHPVRRLLAMVSDHSTLATLLVLGGSWGGALYPIYLWITFGNGFRFGNRYLAASAAVSVVAFAAAGWMNPFWHDHMALTVGLALGLIVLPGYVASLIRKLTVAKRNAEAANHAKSRFLATMSHELRTPLNAVIALSDLLTATRLDSDQRGMVTTIATSGRSLLALINDVLDVAKIEAGKSRPEPVDFDVVAELMAGVDTLRPEAGRKGLEMGFMVADTVPRRARGDVRHLRQILLNLLANAVKFTDHGRVSVEVVSRGDAAGHALTVFVHDTGPGIQPQDRERIFEAFSQLDETAHRRHEGTGLGLAIARQLAHGMNGELRVHATGEVGSTFALDLSLASCSDSACDEDQGTCPVRLCAPGARGTDDLRGVLQAAGAEMATDARAGAVVYDLRGLSTDDGLDGPWLDKLAAQSDRSIPCIVIAAPGSPAAWRLAARFPLAVRAAAPPTPDAVRRALRLVVAGTVRTERASTELHTAVTDRRRQATVLLVEDNPVNSMVITKILETAGYTPIAVDSGDAALDRLEIGGIDAVLMDVNMPGESGIETVKLFRFTEMGDRRRLPIIALTADATPETREACLDAGMDEYITKPVDAGRLLEVLDAHITADRVQPVTVSAAQPAALPGEHASASDQLEAGALEMLLDLDPSGGFLREVAEEFVRDAGILATDISAAGRDGESERASDLLHALKSAAGYAGAARIRDRAVGLQAAVTAGRKADLTAEMAAIGQDARGYRDAVARFEADPRKGVGVGNDDP